MPAASPPTPPSRPSRRPALLALAAVTVVSMVALAAGGWWWLSRAAGPPAAETGPAVLAVAGPAPRPTKVVTFEQGCVTAECHAAMAPGRSSQHPAVDATACAACHSPDTGGHVFPLHGGDSSACTKCHGDMHSGRVEHRAMTEAGCAGCHIIHRGGPFLLQAGSVKGACVTCHPPQQAGHDHPPYATGRCDLCHEPHGSDAPGLLTGGVGSDHCRLCHAPVVELVNTAAYSHARLDGSCQACHAPHTAPADKLMRAETREVCVGCHQQVGREVAGATVSHDAVLKGDQCSTCHEPHGSDNASMLRGDQTSICLKCHAEPVKSRTGRVIASMAGIDKSPAVHGPVASGHCSACHSVHGGSHDRLLRGLNPRLPGAAFDMRNYALCFSCHDPELVLSERGEATMFRDGPTNLHRTHLMSEKGGRSCAGCHAFHGGDLPRLMARSVPFEGSAWTMPIGFSVTTDGGSCSPGCHEPLRYSRTSPVNPPKRKEGGP